MKSRISSLLLSNLLRDSSISPKASIFQIPITNFSTIPNRTMSGSKERDDQSEDFFLRNLNFGDNGSNRRSKSSRPSRGEQRPEQLRGEKGLDGENEDFFPEFDDDNDNLGSDRQTPPHRIPNRPMRGEGGGNRLSGHKFNAGAEGYGRDFETSRPKVPPRFARGSQREENDDLSFKIDDEGYGMDSETSRQKAPPRFARGSQREENDDLSFEIGEHSEDSIGRGAGGKQSKDTFFENLSFGDVGKDKKVEEARRKPPAHTRGSDSAAPEPPLQDADEIFRKMKETGLIPNAVAMLDGLCKDGLVQEAMKLFGLMREKGTIPEIVIYTAVVEGFCKAAKFDDAKRIFRKMQTNGIVPNAYSYMVLIHGFCKGRKLDDCIEFCGEMLDAGHLPNTMTFIGLVDGLCKEKGLEETEGVVKSLRQRGFAVDEKAVREQLDKKGPYSEMVWEAIFGKKKSQRPF